MQHFSAVALDKLFYGSSIILLNLIMVKVTEKNMNEVIRCKITGNASYNPDSAAIIARQLMTTNTKPNPNNHPTTLGMGTFRGSVITAPSTPEMDSRRLDSLIRLTTHHNTPSPPTQPP